MSSPQHEDGYDDTIINSISKNPDEDSSWKQNVKLDEDYQMSSRLFGLTALMLFVIPSSSKLLTSSSFFATKWGGAAGFGLASYAAHLLFRQRQEEQQQSQIISNSLNKDIYQRLHLGLLGFCMFGIPAIPGEAAFWPNNSTMMVLTSIVMTFVRLFGVWVFWRGWQRNLTVTSVIEDHDGVSSSYARLILSELREGFISNMKGIRVRVQDKKISLFYRNTLVLVLFCMFSKFMQGLFGLRYKEALTLSSPNAGIMHQWPGVSYLDTSLQWSGVARLFFVSSILYCLKDLAERGEQKLISSGDEGKLSNDISWWFIRMNYMLSIWALVVGLGQGLALMIPGRFRHRRLEMLVLSGMLFLKGFKKQKQEWDKRQLTLPDSDDKDTHADE